MNRRKFVGVAPLAGVSSGALLETAQPAPAAAFQGEKSRLKITGVKLVQVKPRRPLPRYKVLYEAWSRPDAPKSLPMNKFRSGRQGGGEMFDPNLPIFPAPSSGFTVEISTDKGVTGLGRGSCP